MKIFCLMYLQMILLTLASRFCNRGQYILLFITTAVTGVLNVLVFRMLVVQASNTKTVILYALGSALGGITGIWVHKHFAARKDVAKW